jgi:hypothetical protein
MMDFLSPAGVFGALLGLAVGYVDFRVVSAVVERRLRASDRSTTRAEHEAYERKIALLRQILFVSTVGLFPVLGYWFGRSLGG